MACTYAKKTSKVTIFYLHTLPPILSLSPRLPCFLRSAWSRRRPLPPRLPLELADAAAPLESEPRRVEDLEQSEVLQPVDLEARIRAAQPRAPRLEELGAAAVLDGRGWVDLRAAAA